MPLPLEDATGLIIHGPLSLENASTVQRRKQRRWWNCSGRADEYKAFMLYLVYIKVKQLSIVQRKLHSLQKSWYSAGRTNVCGTMWKFWNPCACCSRWMFLYSRSFRVSSFDLGIKTDYFRFIHHHHVLKKSTVICLNDYPNCNEPLWIAGYGQVHRILASMFNSKIDLTHMPYLFPYTWPYPTWSTSRQWSTNFTNSE